MFCSVAVIHYLSPGCQLHGALQRVDFLCAVGLSVSSGRYIPLLGARSCEAAVSKRVVGHRFLGALSTSVRRWDDSTQSLAQVRFRCLFSFSPFSIVRGFIRRPGLGACDLFLDVLVLSLLELCSLVISTRLTLRAVNPRNGNATYSHEINCRLQNAVMTCLNWLRSSGC